MTNNMEHMPDDFDQLLDSNLSARASARLPYGIEDRLLNTLRQEFHPAATNIADIRSRWSNITSITASIAAVLLLAAGVMLMVHHSTQPQMANQKVIQQAPIALTPPQNAVVAHSFTTPTIATVRSHPSIRNIKPISDISEMRELPKQALFPTVAPPSQAELTAARILAQTEASASSLPASQSPVAYTEEPATGAPPQQLTLAPIVITAIYIQPLNPKATNTTER